MKKITDAEAISILGVMPENFYSYYIFNIEDSDMYVIRYNYELYLCSEDEVDALIYED